MRWGAVLALGEIGSADAFPTLVPLLRDSGRYLRYGAALSLGRLGWQPENDDERAALLIALQDWEGVKHLGAAAAPALVAMLRDNDPATRERIAHCVDRINAKWGRDTVFSAGQGMHPHWAMHRTLMSPRYTTHWQEVLKVSLSP